jgi:hypothetical protein
LIDEKVTTPRGKLRGVANLYGGVATITPGTKIDLSTPKRGDNEDNSSFNTAGTTPQSASTGSSKRRNRIMRKRGQKEEESPKVIETEKTQTKISEEAKVSSIPSKPVTAIDQVSQIIIKIFYETVPGQDLFMIGESPKFGKWDTSKLGLPLKWTNGHIWTGVFSLKSLPKNSVFKFICNEIDGSITWETREDRTFDLSKITYALRTSHRLRTKGQTSLEKGLVKMELDEATGSVTLTYNWGQ